MEKTTAVSADIGGKTITLEAGLLAQQAAGAATVRIGDTVLFAAVTNTATPREGIDWFPLQVEYREKFYAAGKFPGGFFKREARPSEKEILTARLTDRPIRPLFPSAYHNDVQMNIMLLSADLVNDPDALSILAASTVLTLSEIPFFGPVAGLRVGRVNGNFVVNPTHEERAQSDIDLIYCGTRELPMMIEGGAQEVSEADMIAAMKFGHASVVKLIDLQLELRRALGMPDKVVVVPEQDKTLLNAARERAGDRLAELMLIDGKLERQDAVHALGAELKATLKGSFPDMTDEAFRAMFDAFEIDVVRKNLLERGQRSGGRAADELRPLSGLVGILPRTHGSSLFQRGETQAVGIITLGTKSDSQSQDAVAGGERSKKFMLHYNFPPYSVGEVGRLGATGRREIGHGALAERSLIEIIPKDYPYTVRIVADIMGSNGSTSMAAICAGTLALMDAGVPITRPAAGISIGLVTEGDRAVLLTDILGAEDHCGDMDFKVAGTREGITGFQVDLKIPGLTWELVEAAFAEARKARLRILDTIESIIPAPRTEMSEFAPRIETVKIDTEKIGELIGPGGKNIRRITEISGAQIDIEEDGTVLIFATNKESMEIAVREVNMISAEIEEGEIYHGTVTGVKEFGAFVEVLPGRDGLVHISELADFRVNSVDDICRVGDPMTVKCIGIDDRGRIKLSRKRAMAEMDTVDVAEAVSAEGKV
ncbi:MAG: polyribonucleotide nucleotidyltransferase [Verrucomicrobia bacterium]|nr:polyribonucleotide nucleotidyltransferase [Verrucomicrobiota bacterium]